MLLIETSCCFLTLIIRRVSPHSFQSEPSIHAFPIINTGTWTQGVMGNFKEETVTEHPMGFPRTGLEDSARTVKYHACVFFPPFSPPPAWCIVKRIFSLASLSSCENIFSVKHLLEECGDRADPLPVSKAAEWYIPPAARPSAGCFPHWVPKPAPYVSQHPYTHL